MNRRGAYGYVVVFPLLVVALSLAGCAGGIKFTGTAGQDTSRMTPYQKEKINVLVPPGYEEKQIPEGAYKQEGTWVKILGSNPKVAMFQKKESPDHIIVFCWDGLTFVANTSLSDIARHLVTSGMPDGKLVAGTYELGSGFFKKYFEKHSGNYVKEGQNIPAVDWIGWRGTPGLDCKYVLYGVSFGTPGFDDDFVSMIRNVQ
jgi:hypothetical protein